MKKVHYALGAVGLAPALGLMAAPTIANAATHSPTEGSAKTVSLNHRAALADTPSCTGTTHRDTEHSQVGLGFWDTQNAAGTGACIGTIQVSHVLPGVKITVWVSNSHGVSFCKQTKEATANYSAFFGCHRSFREPLWVNAKSSHGRAVSYFLAKP